MDSFDLAERGRRRSVDLDREILEKAAQAQKPGDGELPRETCHGVEKFAEDEDPDLVKVHWKPNPRHNSM